jgi:hypothetical protein
MKSPGVEGNQRGGGPWSALISGLCGAVGPTVIATADHLIGDPLGQREYANLWDVLYSIAPIVWPTQILMELAHGRGHTLVGYSILGLSLVANVTMFSVLGVVCWLLGRLVFRIRATS